MQLFTLAKELRVESKVLMDLLEKPAASSKLTEDEILAAREELAGSAPAQPPTQTEPEPEQEDEVVLFWSEIARHAVPTPDGMRLIRFEDYKLAALKNGIAHKAIAKEHDPDIRIVLNKPFDVEDLGERKQFRQLLESKIKTGLHQEVALQRGLSFVAALFRNGEESAKFASVLNEHGVDGVIELALQTKSYIQS